MGIPVPGETILVTAAVYAGTTGELSVAHVILAAMIGAIAGDNVGFWIGRTVGFRWVVRHRSRLRLTTRRLKLGQYLFILAAVPQEERYFVHWLGYWPGSTDTRCPSRNSSKLVATQPD